MNRLWVGQEAFFSSKLSTLAVGAHPAFLFNGYWWPQLVNLLEHEAVPKLGMNGTLSSFPVPMPSWHA